MGHSKQDTNRNGVTRNSMEQIVSTDNNTETLDHNRLEHEMNVLIDNNSLLALLHFQCCETHAKPNAALFDNLF